jgi:hypothetical protein
LREAAVSPGQIEAHFELMAQNLQLSLMVAAGLTFGLATFWRSAFLRSLLVGVLALSALTIYLNGWPYFQVFFGDAARFPARVALPAAVLLAAGLIGTGLQALWRRVWGQPSR